MTQSGRNWATHTKVVFAVVRLEMRAIKMIEEWIIKTLYIDIETVVKIMEILMITELIVIHINMMVVIEIAVIVLEGKLVILEIIVGIRKCCCEYRKFY